MGREALGTRVNIVQSISSFGRYFYQASSGVNGVRRGDCREGSEITEAMSRRASGWQVQRDQEGLKGKQRV